MPALTDKYQMLMSGDTLQLILENLAMHRSRPFFFILFDNIRLPDFTNISFKGLITNFGFSSIFWVSMSLSESEARDGLKALIIDPTMRT